MAKVQSRLGHQLFADVLGGMMVGAGTGDPEVERVEDEDPTVVEGSVRVIEVEVPPVRGPRNWRGGRG